MWSAFHVAAYEEKQCFVRFTNQSSQTDKIRIEKKFGLVEIRSFLLTKAKLYSIDEDWNASYVVPALRKEEVVEFADYNRKHSLLSQSLDEPLLSQQWYLKNHGLMVNYQSGTNGADIAWESAIQSLDARKKRIVVSVIDTGISADHPELIDKLAYMPAEVEGSVGIDDDGMGYVDDKYGWDFIENDNDPADLNGHGTQVAGIIAAHSENKMGISGIAPNAVILPMRVFNEYGGGATDDRILSALGYSIRGGVRIINLSLGKGSAFSYPLQESLYVLEKDYDVLMVCAAGNGGVDGRGINLDNFPFYPASYEGNSIMSVASTDQNNELSPFSNFGKISVDLAAPGSNVLVPDLSRKRAYFENFEEGLGKWKTEGSSNQNGTPWEIFVDDKNNNWVTDSGLDSTGGFLDYQFNSDSSLLSPLLDLSGLKSPTLSFKIYHDLAQVFFFRSYDILKIEVAEEGDTRWETIGRIYGRSMWGGSLYQFDLSKYEGKRINLRFRLITDNFQNADGIYLDDVEISGVSSFEEDMEKYTFVSGTSFAAPMVSGVAALLLSHRPELLISEVREILLESVTPVKGLQNKILSGGIVNAKNALELATAKRIFLDYGWHFHDLPWIYSPVEDNWNFISLRDANLLTFSEQTKSWSEYKISNLKEKWLFHNLPFLYDPKSGEWYYLKNLESIDAWRGKNKKWHFFDSILESWRMSM